MSRPVRRADRQRPLYARVLRLDHLRPGGVLCFLLFEGAVALAALLSLAELVSWWSVLVLPLVVAGFVKINDLIAGVFAGTDRVRSKVRGVARVDGMPGATAQVTTCEGEGTYRGTAPVALRPSVRRRARNERRFAQPGGVRPVDPPGAQW